MEDRILTSPHAAPVIAGTDGVRKMRYAPPSWNKGKSGALRVCYVCFIDLGTIVLLTAYPKNVQESLTAADKKALNQAVARFRDSLERSRKPPGAKQ